MAGFELTDLTATTSPALTDLLYLVADPAGTPLDRKVTRGDLLGADLQDLITRWTPASSSTAASLEFLEDTDSGTNKGTLIGPSALASDVVWTLPDTTGTIALSASTSGTAFPGSPANNDRFYRTDRDLEYFYDGTQWLTTQLLTVPITNSTALSATNADFAHVGLFQPTYSVYLVDLRGATYVATTNSGSAYWTVELKKASDNAVVGSFSTGTTPDTPSVLTDHVAAIGAVSTEKGLYLSATKTSTPGNLSMYLGVTYRLVG